MTCFVERQVLPIRALVEPNRATDGLYRVVLVIYSQESKMAILNLGLDLAIEKGTKVDEATPLHFQSGAEKGAKISNIREEDTSD